MSRCLLVLTFQFVAVALSVDSTPVSAQVPNADRIKPYVENPRYW